MSSRQKKSLKGGADAPFPIFNHPILDAYLKMNLITSLMPTTLIPLGVLMAVYSTLSQQEVQKGGFLATLPPNYVAMWWVFHPGVIHPGYLCACVWCVLTPRR